MKNIWIKLKKRWEVESNFQVAVILIMFACTGFSTLYTHEFINHLLGIDDGSHFLLRTVIFIFLILPIFNLLLYFWGIIFGQKKFVTKFISLKLNLIFRRKKKTDKQTS